jgi:hypothetical protein
MRCIQRDDWPIVRRFHGSPRPSEFDGNEFDRADRTRVALILGIVSLLVGPLGVFAWMVGADCLRAIRDGKMDPAGESLARAGRLLGIIALGMFAVKVTTLIVLFTFVFDWPW